MFYCGLLIHTYIYTRLHGRFAPCTLVLQVWDAGGIREVSKHTSPIIPSCSFRRRYKNGIPLPSLIVPLLLCRPTLRTLPRLPQLPFLWRLILGEPLGEAHGSFLHGGFLGASGGLMGTCLGPLGVSSGHLAASHGFSQRAGHDLECFGGRLGAILGRHGALFGPSWGPVGVSLQSLFRSPYLASRSPWWLDAIILLGSLERPLGGLLEACCRSLGVSLGPLGYLLGACWRSRRVHIIRLHGESPPPPAFWKRLCGRTLWPELGQAIGLCVPPAVVETRRGTRGGGRRR